jgi:hypothetical protein
MAKSWQQNIYETNHYVYLYNNEKSFTERKFLPPALSITLKEKLFMSK